MHVVTARADRVRNAFAKRVDAAHDLLQPRPRRPDEADAALPHDIGEAKRHAAQDRRPAIRTHYQQTALLGQPLEHTLLCKIDVVAEQEHVATALERLERLRSGVRAGRRDEHEVGGRVFRHGLRDRRWNGARGRTRGRLGDRREERGGAREGRLGCGRAIAGNGHDEVTGAGAGGGGVEQTGRPQDVAVGRRRRQDRRPPHPGQSLDFRGHPHQLHGVPVRVADDPRADDRRR